MNNNAAIGYAIKAAKELGVDQKQIKFFVSEMEHQMNVKTEEQAEKTHKEL